MPALRTLGPPHCHTRTGIFKQAAMDWSDFVKIVVLAIVQGAAELLPVSSSAHVTIAARLLRFDTSRVFEWTFLLVMLHTGTMFAVLIYFWSRWRPLLRQIPALAIATVSTAVVGYALIFLIQRLFLGVNPVTGKPHEIETLFQNLPLMACALAAVGVIIILAGLKDEKRPGTLQEIGGWRAALIGAVQGLALPFRGFSRSGSTISAGMFAGIARLRAEEFSFALAVILTPVVIAREVHMLIKERAQETIGIGQLLLPGLVGMVCSSVAGLVALWWLSRWLDEGRWKLFGIYCLLAAAGVLAVHFAKL